MGVAAYNRRSMIRFRPALPEPRSLHVFDRVPCPSRTVVPPWADVDCQTRHWWTDRVARDGETIRVCIRCHCALSLTRYWAPGSYPVLLRDGRSEIERPPGGETPAVRVW